MKVSREDPKTLQDFLASKLSLSRRAAKDAIDRRSVWVNRKCVWMARYELKTGDVVDVVSLVQKAPVKFHVRILWSNDRYLICDKPAGMISCGEDGSVEEILREQEGNNKLEAVHRLDRDTTGCLLFAKDFAAKQAAVEMFRSHKVSKTYHAIGAGECKYAHLKIDSPLDGENALSLVTREMQGDGACFLRVRIETGRTNQIRRHLSSVRCPVVGDRVFGLKSARDPRLMQVPRQMLHASTLTFQDPFDSHASISAHSPLPADFRSALALFGLGKKNGSRRRSSQADKLKKRSFQKKDFNKKDFNKKNFNKKGKRK